MKPMSNCPVCNGKSLLKAELKSRTFRGEELEVYEHEYMCNQCNHSFTNVEIDNYNLQQVYNKYREKYSIPFPDQLIFIRNFYGLTQTKMSEILGFGPNQYRLYEAGDIPVGGNATVLNIIIEPKEFKNLLEKRKGLLDKKDHEIIIDKINDLKVINQYMSFRKFLFPKNIIPNRFTGYKLPSFKKFSNMVLYFISNAPFKTRLNKLLSFSDFAHFKYFGYSISGVKYAAINMGTVPDQYSIIYGLMEKEGYLKTESVNINGNEVDKFEPLKKFDESIFSESEIDILKKVLDTFKSKSTEVIMNISHQELAWIENVKTKMTIDYSIYAPQLKAI